MHLLTDLFWIGLLLALASTVFSMGMTLLFAGIAGVFAALEWAYNKIKGEIT